MPPVASAEKRKEMHFKEAKAFINSRVQLTWTDRKGEELQKEVDLYQVSFMPFYGPCLITNVGEIRLDRVIACIKANKAAA
jgi:CRISPR/Cas system CMR-associated protein Cmr3 (group 5 of RAMP superfamily)